MTLHPLHVSKSQIDQTSSKNKEFSFELYRYCKMDFAAEGAEKHTCHPSCKKPNAFGDNKEMSDA
jgi:hypothetical protein